MTNSMEQSHYEDDRLTSQKVLHIYGTRSIIAVTPTNRQ